MRIKMQEIVCDVNCCKRSFKLSCLIEIFLRSSEYGKQSEPSNLKVPRWNLLHLFHENTKAENGKKKLKIPIGIFIMFSDYQ